MIIITIRRWCWSGYTDGKHQNNIVVQPNGHKSRTIIIIYSMQTETDAENPYRSFFVDYAILKLKEEKKKDKKLFLHRLLFVCWLFDCFFSFIVDCYCFIVDFDILRRPSNLHSGDIREIDWNIHDDDGNLSTLNYCMNK